MTPVIVKAAMVNDAGNRVEVQVTSDDATKAKRAAYDAFSHLREQLWDYEGPPITITKPS